MTTQATEKPAFKDLDFKPHMNDPKGVHALIFFPNGYGASVVRGRYSYGGERGLYELAVIKGDAESWSLTYATPITDDVRGFLKPATVTKLLGQIAALDGEAA